MSYANSMLKQREVKKRMEIDFGVAGVIDERTRSLMMETLGFGKRRKWVTYGPRVNELEEKFAGTFGYKHAVAMSSGTTADTVAALNLYGINAEASLDRFANEIIVPALAFIAVGEAVYQAGFKPVFVDVKRETQNIDPDKVEQAITDKTRAILAVHSLGKPCDMKAIMEIAKENNLCVIEDGCEAHGAMYDGKYIGHFGDMITFSSYAAHLICSGEGGMLATNDDKIADLSHSIRNHGRDNNSLYFDHIRMATNAKMNDLEACVGIPQTEDFWQTFKKRKKNLNYLLEQVKDLEEFAYFNREEENEVLSPHAFSLVLKDERFNYKELYYFLQRYGINCKRNFGSIPTQHKAFTFMGHKKGDFPEAEYVGNNGLHFAVHQELGLEHMDYASDLLHNYFLSK